MISNKTKTLKRISQKVSDFSPQEISQFFRAFFTPKEISTLCDRYEIVRHLISGMPQREISKKVGVSISAISRGSEELQFGVGAEIFPKIFPEEKC